MAKQNKQAQAQANVSEAVSRTEAYIEKNKKKLSTTIVVIIVLIAAVWLANNYWLQPRQQKALAALSAGEQYFQKGEFKTALNGDTYDYEGFEAIIKKFNGTKAANLAKAYAGLSLAQTGNTEEAVKYLKAFKGKDTMIAPSVLAALGNCLAQNGDVATAAATLEKAAAKADNNLLSPAYLVQAGQLYEQLGNNAKALKVYQKVKDVYYRSNQAADIDKYIEKVSK